MQAPPLTLGHTSTGKWTPEGAFEHIVAPALMGAGMLPRGALIRAEGTSQDQRLGIDWIISGANGAQYTVATRTQWDTDYGTFTIRYRTERGNLSELTKRTLSIRNGGTVPDFTVQAYVTQPVGILLGAYVIDTRTLYQHVVLMADDDEHFRLCSCAARPRWAYGAEFIAVAITEMGKRHAGTKSSLYACGVEVKSLRSVEVGDGLWGKP